MFSYVGDRFLAIRPALRIPVEKRGWLNKNLGGPLAPFSPCLIAFWLHDSGVLFNLWNGCWAEIYNPQMSFIGNIGDYLLICHCSLLSPIYNHLRYVYFKSVY